MFSDNANCQMRDHRWVPDEMALQTYLPASDLASRYSVVNSPLFPPFLLFFLPPFFSSLMALRRGKKAGLSRALVNAGRHPAAGCRTTTGQLRPLSEMLVGDFGARPGF